METEEQSKVEVEQVIKAMDKGSIVKKIQGMTGWEVFTILGPTINFHLRDECNRRIVKVALNTLAKEGRLRRISRRNENNPKEIVHVYYQPLDE